MPAVAIFSPQFSLSPSSFGEIVCTLLHVGRLARKSIPLRPQSTPLGPRLLTHLVTWPNFETLNITLGLRPRVTLINIALGLWPRAILRVSRLGLVTRPRGVDFGPWGKDFTAPPSLQQGRVTISKWTLHFIMGQKGPIGSITSNFHILWGTTPKFYLKYIWLGLPHDEILKCQWRICLNSLDILSVSNH